MSHERGPFEHVVLQVGQDRWHRENDLSGIMVYFENCLVDSYACGQGLPDVVQKKELGYLAIVSFSGPSDKRLFHPNPTKVQIGRWLLCPSMYIDWVLRQQFCASVF